ncbi:MAG: NUDIX domain-containing protein [Gammaproteobacteria bacterium]
MIKKSAGILLYRHTGGSIEVLLAHPGGPYWKNKDLGAWSIPKGEYQGDESPEDAARREFFEETGLAVTGELIELGTVKQPSGKRIIAYAAEGDCSPSERVSNTFALEWPPKSGVVQQFPEIDSVAWFSVPIAAKKIIKGQKDFLQILCEKLDLDPYNRAG